MSAFSTTNFPFGIKEVRVQLETGEKMVSEATIFNLINLISNLVAAGGVTNVQVISNPSPMLEKWQEAVAAGDTQKSYQEWLEED